MCRIFVVVTADNRSTRRGRRRLLDADIVIDRASAILNTEGLEAVSVRRLSAELDISHMTLYGYFESKDALLEALVARTISVPSIQPTMAVPWDEVLLTAMRDIHQQLISRPGIAELLISRQLTSAWGTEVREGLLGVLRSAGYDERQATDGISILFNYLLGAVMIDTRRARGGSASSFELGLQYLIAGLKSDLP